LTIADEPPELRGAQPIRSHARTNRESPRQYQMHRLKPVVLLLFALICSVTAAGAQAASGAPRFSNPPSLPPARGYSQIVEVPPASRLVYIAGQVALDSAGRLVGPGDVRAQAAQVFENLRRALAAVGATFSDVVKLNYYLLDATQAPVLREVRDRFVNTAAPPASTLVEVRRLFRDDVLLEIEAVAVIPRR
jgi:enamine deaminase RidA (YjgF/YER057c/UK114 family)